MAYERTFKMFLAFVLYFQIKDLNCEDYLIQNGMSAVSLQNDFFLFSNIFLHYSHTIRAI